MPYADPEKQREYHREYERKRRTANPEQVREYNRAYRGANRERVCDAQRAWRRENPEKVRAYTRTQRAAHPEKLRARTRAWVAANPEKVRASARAWYAANSEGVQVHNRAWLTSHPEASTMNGARMRARRYGVPCTLTLADVRALLEPMRCSATGLPLARTTGKAGALSPSLDRIVPALGYVPGNVRLVCQRFNTLRGTDPVSHDYRHALRVLAETSHTTDRPC